MKKEKSGNSWLRRGFVIGVAAGSVYLFANKGTRTTIMNGAEGCTKRARHWYTVVKENRESIVSQLKASSEKLQSVIENASDDIEKLVDTAQQMKDHTTAILSVLQESKKEFQELTEKMKLEEASPPEGLSDIEELLPEGGEALPLPEEVPSPKNEM